MTQAEQLAAYLSGDLPPDEQEALEAQLAGDAGLRAELDRIAAADQALAELGPADPSAEFSARLRAAVDAELDVVLGDELAARRARKATRRWQPSWATTAGAAAAALAVVVGASVVLGGGTDDSGDDPTRTLMDADARGAGEGDDAAAFSSTEAEAEGGDGAAIEESMDQLDGPPGLMAAGSPLLVDHGQTATSAYLETLAADPTLLDALGPERENQLALRKSMAEQYALRYTSSLSATTTGGPQDTSESGDGEPAAAGEPSGVEIQGDVDEADRQAVADCLPTVMQAEDGTAVPVYAEIATDADGFGVIIIAVVADTPDGVQARVWMLDRDTCQVLELLTGPAGLQ